MTTAVAFRQLVSTSDLARDIMSALAPTTGDRASGKVLMRARAGVGTAKLPRNWHLLAIVNGSLREDLLFKVDIGPQRAKYPNGRRQVDDPTDPLTDSWWVIDEGGTEVTLTSVVGGNRFNLPAGTVLRFDPPHPDLELDVVVVEGGFTKGTDADHFGACKSIVEFEAMGSPASGLELFRTALNGRFPGLVVQWDGSESADGAQNDTLERGAARAGRGGLLYKESFNIFVISSRMDSSASRRNEGRKLLDDITFLLTDRTEVDGEVFSSPAGVQVVERMRINGDENVFQTHYVYVLRVALTTIWTRYDFRTFNDWLKTRQRTETFEATPDQRVETTDITINMRG